MLFFNALLDQLLFCSCAEVEVAGPFFMRSERERQLRFIVAKLGVLRAKRGGDPDQDVRWSGREVALHEGEGLCVDLGDLSAPACVYGGNRLLFWVVEEGGLAVGVLDAKGAMGAIGEEDVDLWADFR